MQQANLTHVYQFWQQQPLQEFKHWKPASSWQIDWHGETYTEIDQELSHRKIKHSNQQDKLRWGHTTKGMFTTREAYQLCYTNTNTTKDQLWDQIWQSRLWPKERNNRVFNNNNRPIETLWLLLKQNLQETLAIRTWQDIDWSDSPQECFILNSWNLSLSFLSNIKSRPPTRSASPLQWSPPAASSYKLNFDGVAKGNAGSAGFGGVFRNDKGADLHIYYGSIGKDTNNVVKLEGLWKGICIANQKKNFPLEVEGDSLILINAATRIQAGTLAAKIASSWRLLSRLETLEERLRRPHNIVFKHVRCTANKVADRLANQGVNQQLPPFSGTLNDSDDAQLHQ
eukprot:PITA_24712